MKKSLALVALLFAFSIATKAQSTKPWMPYQGNMYGKGTNYDYGGYEIKDTAGTGDTAWLDLQNVRKHIVYINRGVLGDSMNGTVTIAAIDTTVAGHKYSMANLKRDDEMQIEYKTPSKSKRDTIKFAGLFNTGAAVGYVITPSDSVANTHFLFFIFDGTKFFQSPTGK